MGITWLAGVAIAAISVPPAHAQTREGTRHRVREPFYTAVSRGDLIDFREYRYLRTEGLATLWPTDRVTGAPAVSLADFNGIRRADYDRELAARRARADAYLASGRVTLQAPQAVRLVHALTPDFTAWDTTDRTGIASFAARGTHHETVRLVELLEGPQKGQHVWTTARLSPDAPPERVGWTGVGIASSTGGTSAGPAPAPNPGLVADGLRRDTDRNTGIPILVGTVRNTTSQALRDIEVEVEFLNQGGEQVARDRVVSTEPIEAGAVWQFALPWPGLAVGAVTPRAIGVRATPVFPGLAVPPPPASLYK